MVSSRGAIGLSSQWTCFPLSVNGSFDFAQDDKLEMQCAIGLVISDQGSGIRTRHAFFGKKVPEGRMMVGFW